MYNDHPWDPKIVVVVDRWSLLEVVVGLGLIVFVRPPLLLLSKIGNGFLNTNII